MSPYPLAWAPMDPDGSRAPMSSPTPSPPDLQPAGSVSTYGDSSASTGRDLGRRSFQGPACGWCATGGNLCPGGVVGEDLFDRDQHRRWCEGGTARKAGMPMHHALVEREGQCVLWLQVRPDLDTSPHGATESCEVELEAIGHLLLQSAVESQDGDNVEICRVPR